MSYQKVNGGGGKNFNIIINFQKYFPLISPEVIIR